MDGMVVCFQSLGKVKRRKLHKFVIMTSIPFITVYSTLKEKSTFEFSNRCNLFVELGQHHISQSVFDPADNKLLDIEMINLNEDINSSLVQSYLEDSGIDTEQFGNVHLIFNTKEFALIPSSLHNPLFHRDLVETIHGDMLDLQFNADQLSHFDAVNVYGVQREINTVLNRFFPNAQRVHKNACIVKGISSQLDRLPSQFIKIFFSPSHIDVLVVKNGKLQFLQKFYYETTDDAIFYILTLSEKFKLNRKAICFFASGIIDLDSLILFELKKHFPLFEIEISKEYSITSHIAEIPAHYLTPLMISLQCV
jgi:hypothetical protein